MRKFIKTHKELSSIIKQVAKGEVDITSLNFRVVAFRRFSINNEKQLFLKLLKSTPGTIVFDLITE